MHRIAVISCLILLMVMGSGGVAQSQPDRDILMQKQAQSEMGADSDRYVIGAEDILYIHVWREEALSRTVPVRMDGHISLPLIHEVKAAGLTPLQLKEEITKKLKEFILFGT